MFYVIFSRYYEQKVVGVKQILKIRMKASLKDLWLFAWKVYLKWKFVAPGNLCFISSRFQILCLLISFFLRKMFDLELSYLQDPALNPIKWPTQIIGSTLI